MKYMPISFNPAELQLLETNKLTEQQICSLFRVPPTFLQDYNRATFANAEQQGLIYKTYTLQPFITNFMQEIDAKCFPESNQRSETPNYINFNLNGLLAGDYKTRTEGYRSLFQMGVPLNHFMALEDQNPVDGGDVGYVPMNMIRVDKAEAFADKLIATTGSKEKAGERSLADILTEHGIKLQTNGHEHV
jgi:phage portal protein BeeE